MSTSNFSIQGMSCGHCITHVTQAINSIPGARAVSVRVGAAAVDLAPGVDPRRVIEAVRDAGYEATLENQEVRR